MLKLDVGFYDGRHQDLLRGTCPRYDQLERLTHDGLDIEAEELFSYSMFAEQVRTEAGWQTYRDLVAELAPFRQTWERHFDCSALTVSAKRETSEIPNHHKEALGVGGALAVVSHAYGLTEADWQKIPEHGLKTLDFQIASTGTDFIEVEAKGSVVPDYHKTHLSDAKGGIEKKKRAQRDLSNTHTMIGVITAIPSDRNLRTRCYLLDPPPEELSFDPFKYKLLARLHFYWRELRLVSRAHFLHVLANRIQSILLVSDYRSLDGLPLLNIYGEPHQVPDSLFLTRSSVYGRSAFGEMLPLGDGRFFFYGFDTDIVGVLVGQRFDELNGLSFEPRVRRDSRVSAKIPRRLLGGAEENVEFDEDKEDEARKTVQMVGDLTHTRSGRVLGYVGPADSQSIIG